MLKEYLLRQGSGTGRWGHGMPGVEICRFSLPEQVGEYSAIAFGCPSMGSEQLEESEFEPMFTACEGRLSGKNIALFGSYGWGDGEWMRSWESRCNDDGANLACESVICNEAPDDDALAACRELGASLA